LENPTYEKVKINLRKNQNSDNDFAKKCFCKTALVKKAQANVQMCRFWAPILAKSKSKNNKG